MENSLSSVRSAQAFDVKMVINLIREYVTDKAKSLFHTIAIIANYNIPTSNKWVINSIVTIKVKIIMKLKINWKHK